MKLVIKTVFFHFLCIFIFALFYFYFRDGFSTQQKKENFTILDYVFLSTTIQAGVGLTDIYPISFYTKIIMIIQQILMLMTHVLTLYIFNL
jgi:hypothetical protein